MNTHRQNLKTTEDRSQYTQTLCQPQCEIFKDYTRYSELVYTITSLDELGQRALEAIVANLDPGDDICQIVVSPRQPIYGSMIPGVDADASQLETYEWVLVVTRENLVLLDSTNPDTPPLVRKVPIQNIFSITWGKILLQSWVEWSWVDGPSVAYARVNFNSTGGKPMEETLGYLLGVDYSNFGTSIHAQFEQRQFLNTFPYRFVESLPLLLNPQEKICAAAIYPYQPAVWKSWHGLFRRQERGAIPSIAIILTERLFVMLSEADHDTGLSLGTSIQMVQRKNIVDLCIENALDGPRLILLVSDKNVEERISVRAPENCFQEIIQRFRPYLSSRSNFGSFEGSLQNKDG